MLTGPGNAQTIDGVTYEMYSPQWYAAMRKNKITNAQTAGTAAGSGAKAALDALGQVSGSAPVASTSSATSGGSSGLPPRVGSSGGGSSLPDFNTLGAGGGGGSTSPIPQISKPDQSASEAAVFGKAKDQIGQESAGALTGLRSALGGRGMLGSGAEYRGTQNVITKGQGELGDVTRQQAVTHLGNEMDIEKSNQAAALAGRGQDISAETSRRGQNIDYTLGGRGQEITQRGQDIQYEESQAQLALTKSLQEAAQRQQILNGIMGAINGATLY